MKQMQDDSYLIIKPTIPTGIREGGLSEPSGPNSINPGNTNGSGNPESTTSWVSPLVGGTIQPGAGQVSIEKQVPNPLRKIIHIYSEDKSPEASNDIPVCVQEEKGLENTSSLEPKVQDKDVLQEEIEV
jgi:hypothetical protein